MSEYTEKLYNFPPIEKGTVYHWNFNIEDDYGRLMDSTFLVGASISCIVKAFPQGPTLQDLSAYFTIDAGGASVTMSMTNAETNAINWSEGYYRLILTLASGASKVLLYGNIPVDLG